MLAALAAALVGCGKAEAVYGRDDTSISVNSGEKFTIKLDANPTTGYEWNVSVSDESVVTLEKSEYQQGGSGGRGRYAGAGVQGEQGGHRDHRPGLPAELGAPGRRRAAAIHRYCQVTCLALRGLCY